MSFDKFTDKARKVLVLAQDEARAPPPALRGHRAHSARSYPGEETVWPPKRSSA